MPKSIKEILKEYNQGNLNQKSENNLTFGVSINEKLTPSTKPAKTKVPGLDTDDASASAGRGEFLVKQVKDNLRSLGFSVSDFSHQNISILNVRD